MYRNRVIILTSLLICLLTISIKATNSDIKDFLFTIQADKWESFSSDKHSYKYYAGTKKLDKSSYVVNTERNSGVSMWHYFQNNKKRKSKDSLQSKIGRNTYKNWGEKNHKGKFLAKRQNWWDGQAIVWGTWSSDDRKK